jgi:predicted DNA-binding transcriptional regulator YafY
MGMLGNVQSELLQPMLKPIVERLEGLLTRMGYDRERIQLSASLHPLGLREVSQPIFEQLTQAVLQSRGVRIAYHARYNDASSLRNVDPQRLILHRDNWYLVAYCHQATDLRVFACDRITSVEESAHESRRISPGEIGERLARGFGIFMGSGRAKSASRVATLLFTPERARWVRDEQWHPRQKGTTQADGSYRLELPYENATELVLEILRHGSEVQVLAPPALREAVAQEWQRAAALYQPSSSAKS